MNHPLLQKASIVFSPTAYGTSTLNSIKPPNTEVENSVTSFANGTTYPLTTFTSTSNNVTSGIVSSAFGGCVSNGIALKSKQKVRVRFDYTQNSGDELRVLFSSVVTGAGTVMSDYTFTITSNTTGYLQLGTGNSGHSINFSALNVRAEILPTADFYFNRSTTATRVNESGLIETVAANIPRIDYLSGVGAYLNEPQSTNLITYSNDFSNAAWTKQSGISATYNTTETLSPEGLNNASKFTGNGTNGIYIQFIVTGIVARSIYLKSVTGNVSVTIKDPVLTVTTKTLNLNETWQRFELIESNGHGSASGIWIDDIPASGIYIYGAQLEEATYATSYIPTSGATVTRNKDLATNAGNTDLINSPEGVLYINAAGLNRTFSATRRISLSDGTTDNEVRFDFTDTEDRVTLRVRVGSSNVATKTITGTYNISQFHKYAIQWKLNDFKFYIDGVEVATDTSGATYSANTLDRLNIATGSASQPLEANIKCIAVFKEILTDAELVTLTS